MQTSQAKQLLRSIYADDNAPQADEEPLCHENQNDLAAYIYAELDGREVQQQFPEIHVLIHECPSCRRAYEELKELFVMEREEQFVEPPLALPSLVKETLAALLADDDEKPSIIDVVEEKIRWQLNKLGEMTLRLSEDFVAGLQPSAQPVYLKSAAQDLFEISSPDIADDLAVTLAAREMRRKPESCAITVTAEIPSRGGWPNLGETEITLTLDDQESETQYTDAFGKAVFSGIDKGKLAGLSVTVKPSE